MDLNTLAKSIVDQVTGEKPSKRASVTASNRGYARKEALTPERRRDIAKKAASVRWKGKQPSGDTEH